MAVEDDTVGESSTTVRRLAVPVPLEREKEYLSYEDAVQPLSSKKALYFFSSCLPAFG